MGAPLHKVSVVIPSHGRPAAARAAVASALGQTVAPLEVLVVVDGPDPSAYDDLEDLVGDGRLRVIRPRVQLGPSGARNLGVQQASGDVIAFLDDDDCWMPVKLERQLAAVAAAGVDDGPYVSTTAVVAASADSASRWPARDPLPGESVADFLFGLGPAPRRGRVLQTSTFVCPRTHALAVPMRGRAFEDWDWLVRAAYRVPYVHVPEQLTVFTLGSGTSLSDRLSIAEGEAWLDALRPFISDEAYSAGCLTALARRAACIGTGRDMLRLVGKSFRGRPRPLDLLEFPLRIASMWPERRRSHHLRS